MLRELTEGQTIKLFVAAHWSYFPKKYVYSEVKRMPICVREVVARTSLLLPFSLRSWLAARTKLILFS